MKNSETNRLDWKDMLFGLIGSTIVVVLLQLFTS